MADEMEEWSAVLPQVFDLLLNKPERIVDDTSLEKLLAFISDVCSTPSGRHTFLEHVSPFLSNENVILKTCTTVSFALRVCGILWSRDSSLIKEYPVWRGLLAKCRESEVLWSEAVVRDAYFIVLQDLTSIDTGLHWLHDNQGVLKTAVECMSTDSSMYVTSNARMLIAKFLISSYSGERSERDLHNVDRLMECLHEKLPLGTTKTADRIAILDIIRMLMSIDASVGQKLLCDKKLLVHIVNMVNTVEDDVCSKLVEVIGEIKLNYSNDGNAVAWDKMLCCDTSDGTNSAAQTLLKIILDLYQRGMIGDSLNLISVLACSRDEGSFPSNWLDVLCCLISAPLAIFEGPALPLNKHISNGLHNQPIDRDTLAADLMFLATDNAAEFEILKNKIKDIIMPWVTSRSMKILTLNQALSSITDIVNKGSSIPCHLVTQWIEFALKILKSSINHEPQNVCVEIHGNDKIIKTTVTVLVALLKHLLLLSPNVPDTTINYFFQTLQACIFLVRSSQTNPTIITSTLESIGDLIEHGASILNKLYQDTSKNNDSIPSDPKRPRMVNDHQSIVESMGFTLHLRLRDQRWEVKDSALEFVTRLVKLGTGFSINIVEHQALALVWDALDDMNESYVRSSAWQALAYIADNHHLWIVLRDNQHLTEISVITKIAHTLEHDSEAFPRRSVIDCILMWIRNRNPIVATLLPKAPEAESTAEGSPRSTTEMTSLFCGIIQRGFKDFDWEVKLRMLSVIQAIIDNFCGDTSKCDKTEDRDDTTHSNLDKNHCDTTKQLFIVMDKIGALAPILKACDDCDNLVCEKALSVLGSLKSSLCRHLAIESESGSRDHIDDVSSDGEDKTRPILTVEQLLEAIESATDLSTEMFKDIVCRLDVQGLVSSCRATDFHVRSNPVCLLEDIIAGVRQDTENLLDCY